MQFRTAFSGIKGSKYMLVHSLASKYARFVIMVRQIYWTPPSDHWTPPLLKSDDLFFREPRDIGPPPFKNPGHAPDLSKWVGIYSETCLKDHLSIKTTWLLRPPFL